MSTRHHDFENRLLSGERRRTWPLLVALVALMPLSVVLGAVDASRVDLTIKDGPHAGSYSIKSSLGCDFQDFLGNDDSEPATFFGDFVTETRPGTQLGLTSKQLGQVFLQIPDYKARREDVFALQVVFGQLSGSAEDRTLYDIKRIPVHLRSEIDLAINGEEPMSGKGRVTFKGKGREATITFSGETADAVRIEGVIQCK